MRVRFSLIVSMVLLCGLGSEAAVLGMERESYGVWDRSGWHSVAEYPFTRGQEMNLNWIGVNPARSNFTWTAIDDLLQFADDQNQMFTVKVAPVEGGSGQSMPPWMFSAGVPSFTESPDTGFVYGYYLDPEFKIYFEEMVRAFAKHVRQDVDPNLQNRIAFVRVDTGATGDEEPYENGGNVPAQYQINDAQWLAYRLWAFELYRQAFQEGPGPVIPLLFVHAEPISYADEWTWIINNVTGGAGAKYDGSTRGHHLSKSGETADQFKPLAVDSDFKMFSRSEMDGTWSWPFWQANIRLSAYWCAIEQLHAGMSLWDVTGSFLENTYIDDFGFAFDYFNKWAAELVPATARGGFCVFHEGLDSSDEVKFPTGTYGSPANQGNQARYTAICAAYAGQGAQMDDLFAATKGHVWQRPNQVGFNDSGWKIVPGNYDRFITQINPDTTSKALWRVRGTLNASSHPYDRFARRFDNASGMNTMSFDVNDDLTPNPGQSIELSVIYLDSGTGQFALQYDAVGNSQKTAFTVTKSNSNTWKTNSVIVTDWAFGNSGPNGADLMLVNVDTEDDIFHSIELVKYVDVTLNTVGQGTIAARNDADVYDPVTGTYATGLRLEMMVTPAQGWEFSGWSGDLSGNDPREILFPTNVDTQVTATFVNTGYFVSQDDFNTGTWIGGTGWTGGWTVIGTATPGAVVELNGTTANPQITRTLEVPIPNATLSFDWDLDRIGAGESGQVEVYDGVWRLVWQQADPGTDPNTAGDVNLLPATIDLSAYGSISQIRFILNASGSNNRFYIDNVSLTGSSGAPVNTAPTFTVAPINKPEASAGLVYSNTIAGSATDVDAGDSLTYSKEDGPAWLSVAANGVLSGTPGSGDVGANVFTVKVEDAALASDTAALHITVHSTYSVWSNQYSLAQGLAGDDDGDGLKNLAEFGLGGNPTNPADQGISPTYGLASGGGSNWLEYIHVRQTDPNSGLRYYLELSDNLVSNVWTTNGYTVAGSGPFTNGFDAVTNRIEADSKDQQFIRLMIEQN